MQFPDFWDGFKSAILKNGILVMLSDDKVGDFELTAGDDIMTGLFIYGDVDLLSVTRALDRVDASFLVTFGDDVIPLAGGDGVANCCARDIIVGPTKDAAPVQMVAGDDTLHSGTRDDALWGDFAFLTLCPSHRPVWAMSLTGSASVFVSVDPVLTAQDFDLVQIGGCGGYRAPEGRYVLRIAKGTA